MNPIIFRRNDNGFAFGLGPLLSVLQHGGLLAVQALGKTWCWTRIGGQPVERMSGFRYRIQIARRW